MDDMPDRVRKVLEMDPASHATRSRDFGRGFAECLRLVKATLLDTEPAPREPEVRRGAPPQTKRQPPVCMIPGCGCIGEAHP